MQNAYSEIEELNDLNEKGKYDGKEPMNESCLRIINHQNSHLRQIWMIIGYLKLNETKWPKQGKWLINPNEAKTK